MHVLCAMPSMGVRIQTFINNEAFSSHAGVSDSPIEIIAPSAPGTFQVAVGCASRPSAPAVVSFSVTEGIRFLRPRPNEKLTYGPQQHSAGKPSAHTLGFSRIPQIWRTGGSAR